MTNSQDGNEIVDGVVARQVAERRRHILSVTRAAVAESGYEALNMRDLAVRCGVSVPTLYRQFGGKQALVREAVQEHFVSAIVGERTLEKQARGHLRLLEILDTCGADIRRMPAYYRQLMAVFVAEHKPGTEGDAPGVGMPINDRIVAEIGEALQQMRDAGHLHDWVDIELTAERIASEAMIAAIQWAMGMLSSRGYHAALVYACSMMLVGASRGLAARAFRQRIEGIPRAARLRSSSSPKER